MGETRGYKIKNGQNPNGVQHAITKMVQPFQGCVIQFAIAHGFYPWLCMFNHFVVGKNEVVCKKKSGMSEFPTYHFCKSNKNKATLKLVINIFPMTKRNNIYNKFIIENIIDDSIIACSNSITISSL